MSEIQRQKQRNTLCWDCARATGACSWSQSFVPVKGWQAIPTKQKAFGYSDTYIVISCPLFVRDSTGYGQKHYKE